MCWCDGVLLVTGISAGSREERERESLIWHPAPVRWPAHPQSLSLTHLSELMRAYNIGRNQAILFLENSWLIWCYVEICCCDGLELSNLWPCLLATPGSEPELPEAPGTGLSDEVLILLILHFLSFIIIFLHNRPKTISSGAILVWKVVGALLMHNGHSCCEL